MAKQMRPHQKEESANALLLRMVVILPQEYLSYKRCLMLSTSDVGGMYLCLHISFLLPLSPQIDHRVSTLYACC